jgi:hypothetical protein
MSLITRCNECGYGQGWHTRSCVASIKLTAPAIKQTFIPPKQPSEAGAAIVLLAIHGGCLFFAIWVIKTIWSIV